MKHGDYFVATIEGRDYIGQIEISKHGSIYLCQNKISNSYREPLNTDFRNCYHVGSKLDNINNMSSIYNFRVISKARYNLLSKSLKYTNDEFCGYSMSLANNKLSFGCGLVNLPIATLKKIVPFLNDLDVKNAFVEIFSAISSREFIDILDSDDLDNLNKLLKSV